MPDHTSPFDLLEILVDSLREVFVWVHVCLNFKAASPSDAPSLRVARACSIYNCLVNSKTIVPDLTMEGEIVENSAHQK